MRFGQSVAARPIDVDATVQNEPKRTAKTASHLAYVDEWDENGEYEEGSKMLLRRTREESM